MAQRVWSALPIGGGGYRCANIMVHRCTLHRQVPYRGHILALDNVNVTLPNGGPNSLVHLAYFHAKCLLTGPYKRETEIHDNKIKKQTDIDRHGPKPSSNSSQPPDPPDFSLLTTFNKLNSVLGEKKIYLL